MSVKQQRINDCLNLVRVGSRKVNEIRGSKGNAESDIHYNLKKEICENLSKEGKSFVTEAIFENGKRADILVLDDFKIIEIVNTELEESIENKKNSYPDVLKIEVVRVKKKSLFKPVYDKETNEKIGYIPRERS